MEGAEWIWIMQGPNESLTGGLAAGGDARGGPALSRGWRDRQVENERDGQMERGGWRRSRSPGTVLCWLQRSVPFSGTGIGGGAVDVGAGGNLVLSMGSRSLRARGRVGWRVT